MINVRIYSHRNESGGLSIVLMMTRYISSEDNSNCYVSKL